MGYAVYFDNSQGRWAGYGVPAECDHPDCHTMIDHGLGCKCETITVYTIDKDTGEETEDEAEGCGLFFCEDHLYLSCQDIHFAFAAKPDHPAWMLHMLTDESWGEWRHNEPAEVARFEEVLSDPAVRALAERVLEEA